MEHYKFIQKLGNGRFGSVRKAYDIRNQRYVAIKMPSRLGIASAVKEIKTYNMLMNKVDTTEINIAIFYDSFLFNKRWCVVMELLGSNLFEILDNSQEGLNVKELQAITKSVLSGLQFLHENLIIHCDLKTDNIVVKDLISFECKIIDLRNCLMIKPAPCWKFYYPVDQNPLFCAPEVFMKATFNECIDIFCVGLILAHLSTKSFLFDDDIILRQMAEMVEYLGFPPRHVIKNSWMGTKFFVLRYNSISFRQSSSCGIQNIIPKSRHLSDFFKNSDPLFISFLETCLDMNPAKRGSARTLKNHLWLTAEERN